MIEEELLTRIEADLDRDSTNRPIEANWNPAAKHEDDGYAAANVSVSTHAIRDDNYDSEDVPLLAQSDDPYIDNIPLLTPSEKEHWISAYLARPTQKLRWHLSYLKSLPVYPSTDLRSLGRHLKSALPTYCTPSRIPPPRQGPTAYLDSLRGYAAVIVYIFHLYDQYGDLSWRRFPFVSTFFGGAGMVSVFFVISGHVLGYGLLLSIHRRDEGRMLQGLASALFRRYLRLYGSVVVAMIFTLVLMRLGFYKGVYLYKPYHEDIIEQLKDWFLDIFNFCNPFSGQITDVHNDWPLASSYLPQMWTIPVEFRGSIFLFAFCAAICKLTTKARIIVMVVVILMAYCWQAVYVAEFTGGLLIAQLSLVREPERISEPSSSTVPIATNAQPAPRPRQSLLSKIAHTVLFIVAFILLGENDAGQTQLRLWGSFPWVYLTKMVPPWWREQARYLFWLSWGSLGLVYSLEFYPTLRRPLEWRVSHYIGDLSFGIYAMHVPVGMGLRSEHLESWRKAWAGEARWGYLVQALVITVLVMTAADYFTQMDRAVVRLGRSFQQKLFTKW